jgi:hypothetical protein
MVSVSGSCHFKNTIQEFSGKSEEEAFKLAMSAYEGECCGICEKRGPTHIFFNPKSRLAHEECLESIHDAYSPIKNVITQMFKHEEGFLNFNGAQIEVICAIQKKIHGETIATYLQKNGNEALKELFINEGLKAVYSYSPM